MTHIGKVFKAGNSAAVRLPKDVAFALGTSLSIERRGDVLTLKPIADADAIRQDWLAFAQEIQDVWADAPFREIERRDPDIFPDRPGLY